MQCGAVVCGHIAYEVICLIFSSDLWPMIEEHDVKSSKVEISTSRFRWIKWLGALHLKKS